MGNFVVSARKYRPQRFEDVFGQAHVTDTLRNAILGDKLAHAFLFNGPRGVGKTTCARILAKVMNCPDPKVAVVDGSYVNSNIDISLNILELDGASNNSVEAIRGLIEQLRFTPHQGKYKIFIIDEVHMLSTSAFNAFLKTLEEPPPFAIFILATTEKHKVLPTILSRCQVFDFKRIAIEEIISQLEIIAKEENIKVEKDSLYFIAEKADGGMRDALSIFDRISNASNSVVDYNSVIKNLNILDYDFYFKLCNAFLTQDSDRVILYLEEILQLGFELESFLQGLCKHLRNLFLSKSHLTQPLIIMGEAIVKQYNTQAEVFPKDYLLTALSLCQSCDLQISKASDKRFYVEMCLLKICYLQRIITGDNTNYNKEPQEVNKKKIDNESTIESKEKNDNIDSIKNNLLKSDVKPISKLDDVLLTKESNQTNNLQKENTERESKIRQKKDNWDVDSMLKTQIAEIKKPSKQRSLNLSEVHKIWDNYKQATQSQSLKASLEHTLITIVDEHSIEIVVPSAVSQENILHEVDLIEKIRAHFNHPKLNLLFKIDRSHFPELEEQEGLINTVEDKYIHLNKTNPLFEVMINKLNLLMDH